MQHLMLWLGTFTILPVMPTNVMVSLIYHSSCNATSNVMVRYILGTFTILPVMQHIMLWLGTFTILPVMQHLML